MKPYCMWCGCESEQGNHTSQEDCSKAKAKAIAWWDVRIKDAVEIYNKTGQITQYLPGKRW